jgi:hypothetical protein
MSVGPKWGVLGRKWATIVTDAASLSHLDSDHASNTFLVLGPIDLTNGRAGMDDSLQSTLRGTFKHRLLMNKNNVFKLITGLRPFGKLRMSITETNYIRSS